MYDLRHLRVLEIEEIYGGHFPTISWTNLESLRLPSQCCYHGDDKLPLKVLWADPLWIGEFDHTILSRAKNLRSIAMSDIYDEDLELICDELKQLEDIDISNCYVEDFSPLCNLPKLETLIVQNCEEFDFGTAWILVNNCLKKLDCVKTRVLRKEHFSYLARHLEKLAFGDGSPAEGYLDLVPETLKYLNLSFSTSFEDFRSLFTRVNNIQLDCPLSDSCFPLLAQCQQLAVKAEISWCNVMTPTL
jgi:hypothetical protein